MAKLNGLFNDGLTMSNASAKPAEEVVQAWSGKMAKLRKTLASMVNQWPVAILAFGGLLSIVWIGAMVWFALALVRIV
jgi:hypothetical protein